MTIPKKQKNLKDLWQQLLAQLKDVPDPDLTTDYRKVLVIEEHVDPQDHRTVYSFNWLDSVHEIEQGDGIAVDSTDPQKPVVAVRLSADQYNDLFFDADGALAATSYHSGTSIEVVSVDQERKQVNLLLSADLGNDLSIGTDGRVFTPGIKHGDGITVSAPVDGVREVSARISGAPNDLSINTADGGLYGTPYDGSDSITVTPSGTPVRKTVGVKLSPDGNNALDVKTGATAGVFSYTTGMTWDNDTKFIHYTNNKGTAQHIDLSQFAVDLYVDDATYDVATTTLVLKSVDPDMPDVTVDLGALAQSAVTDTTSIAMSGTGATGDPLKGTVKISADPNNMAEVRSDGVYAHGYTGVGLVARDSTGDLVIAGSSDFPGNGIVRSANANDFVAAAYGSVALGVNSIAASRGTVVLGESAWADGEEAISIGLETATSQPTAMAIGSYAESHHLYSVALGPYTSTSKQGQMSVAYLDPVTHLSPTPVLISGVATPEVAQDAANKQYVDDAVGSGGLGLVTRDAFGALVTADETDFPGVRLVRSANASTTAGMGASSVALGEGAVAETSGAVVIGKGASTEETHHTGQIAIGMDSVTGDANTCAIGHLAEARGYSSTAIGASSKTHIAQAVALGYGSRMWIDDAPVANSVQAVSVGSGGPSSSAFGAPETRRIINVSSPVHANDAATKDYVDSALLGSGVPDGMEGQFVGYNDNDEPEAKYFSFYDMGWPDHYSTLTPATTAHRVMGENINGYKYLLTFSPQVVANQVVARDTQGNILLPSPLVIHSASSTYPAVSKEYLDSTYRSDSIVIKTKTTGANVVRGRVPTHTTKAGWMRSADAYLGVDPGEYSITLGSDARSEGDVGIAIGRYANVMGAGSVAIGSSAQAAVQLGTAVGTLAEVAGTNGVAIGIDSSTSHVNGVALGSATRTSKVNQVAVATLDPETHLVAESAHPRLISGVATPVVAQDAANKEYVDARTFGVGQSWTDVTGQRVVDTNYFNSNVSGPKLMAVSIRATVGPGSSAAIRSTLGVTVSLAEVYNDSSSSRIMTMYAHIIPGTGYRVELEPGTTSHTWWEYS